MPVCPTLRFSFLNWGKGSSLSQTQVSQPQVSQPQVSQPQVTLPKVTLPQVARLQVARLQVARLQVARLQVARLQAALHLNLASMRRLEIMGDHLEGLIDWPYRKRA